MSNTEKLVMRRILYRPAPLLGVVSGLLGAILLAVGAVRADDGFYFQRFDPVQLSDFRAFFGEEVSSGRLDYWFKEAHSELSSRVFSQIVNEGVLQD
ncbi:MAG: hypothetical protein ACK5QT_02470 [Oligoflexia bacterium]